MNLFLCMYSNYLEVYHDWQHFLFGQNKDKTVYEQHIATLGILIESAHDSIFY